MRTAQSSVVMRILAPSRVMADWSSGCRAVSARPVRKPGRSQSRDTRPGDGIAHVWRRATHWDHLSQLVMEIVAGGEVARRGLHLNPWRGYGGTIAVDVFSPRA